MFSKENKLKKACSLLALIVFACGYSVAMGSDEVELSYHPEAGYEWTVSSVLDAKVPIVGDKHVAVSYDLSCTDSSDDSILIDLHVPQVNVEGSIVGPVEASFALSPWGDVSRMTSSQLNDPLVGPLLKNVGVIFPKLPGGVVSVGAGWTGRELLYLPKLGKMDLPEKIRLDGGYNYLGTVNGMEEISVSYREADGNIKVKLDGKCFFDPETGIVANAVVTGTIKVKRFFKWFTIPVSIKATLQ